MRTRSSHTLLTTQYTGSPFSLQYARNRSSAYEREQ